MTIDELLLELREVVQDQLDEIRESEERHQGTLVLPDVPGEPFPDTWLIQNEKLREEGRVAGKDLWRRGSFSLYSHPGTNGTRSVGMLRSSLECAP